jgi:hypothetical protein
MFANVLTSCTNLLLRANTASPFQTQPTTRDSHCSKFETPTLYLPSPRPAHHHLRRPRRPLPGPPPRLPVDRSKHPLPLT